MNDELEKLYVQPRTLEVQSFCIDPYQKVIDPVIIPRAVLPVHDNHVFGNIADQIGMVERYVSPKHQASIVWLQQIAHAIKMLEVNRPDSLCFRCFPALPLAQPLVEPLSQRELEVLQLIAQGLSNREISERLFLALSTVKGHNQRIFDKLQVQSRTEAVARARELGLL